MMSVSSCAMRVEFAIRSGARALQLSERGDVLAILREQARLRGKRRTQAVFHGG